MLDKVFAFGKEKTSSVRTSMRIHRDKQEGQAICCSVAILEMQYYRIRVPPIEAGFKDHENVRDGIF